MRKDSMNRRFVIGVVLVSVVLWVVGAVLSQPLKYDLLLTNYVLLLLAWIVLVFLIGMLIAFVRRHRQPR
jgi:predicted branched-subunit amino acid permease